MEKGVGLFMSPTPYVSDKQCWFIVLMLGIGTYPSYACPYTKEYPE